MQEWLNKLREVDLHLAQSSALC